MAALSTFEDLSGTATPAEGENPYSILIDSCNNDPNQINNRYSTHRTTRNTQQTTLLLSPTFPGLKIDTTLHSLTTDPSFTDPRNCLVFWARPPTSLRTLISTIQTTLTTPFPQIWTMPSQNLHMTALEIAHSLTPEEIEKMVQPLTPNLQKICDYTLNHRAKLVRPLLSFDAQAVALSFVPAPGGEGEEEGGFGYHHLRRDLFALVRGSGVEVRSRYVVPSAHLTIARFVDVEGIDVGAFVRVIEGVNEWLRREFWGDKGSWVVGEQKGLECRKGRLWYGGGEQVYLGKGF